MKTPIVRSIKGISVEGLFGVYDYSLAIPSSKGGGNKIMILYGDNGSGKTTILRLAFHLLAPEDNEGHKSEVAAIPFRRFEIELLDRTRVLAERQKGQLRGSFSVRIRRPRKKEMTFHFLSDQNFSVTSLSEKHGAQIRQCLSELREFQIGLYMLSDDRQIHLAGRKHQRGGPSDVDFAEEGFFFDSESRIRTRWEESVDPEQIAQQLLSRSIERVESWIRSLARRGSSIGESSVNALYNETLKRVVALPRDESLGTTSTKKSIEKRVSKLESKCREFAKYGLMPEFQGREILTVVKDASSADLDIIANVLDPYLESLEKKLEALADTHRRVNSLATVINRFLTNKVLTFDLHSGLAVTANDGKPLDPPMLSSGERHLLLLFCNSLIAVDRPSIMMIDEPEISLNIKWQRRLLSSLLECIGDSPVQYIFATHSIELLAQHRDRIVKLDNLRKS